MAKKNCSNIGGQAVLEGVMMKGKSSIATAVRDQKGIIQVESSFYTPSSKRSVFFRIPIIRGVFAFIDSMVTGTKILTRASEVYGDLSEEQPTKLEKWLANKFKIDIMNVATFVGVFLGILLAVGLFILLPQAITSGIINLFKLEELNSIFKNLIAGAIRIGIFVGYISLVSLMKDIKRLFMYHGAEHKVISCYEHNLPLTIENAQTMSTVHDRCGTTFMIIVMVFSIIFFSFFGWQELWLRVLTRILCLPLVAGISYELLKLFAKSDSWWAKICKAPGLWLQKLTTKQPDDKMVEVAIRAFTTVMAMDADKNYPTTKFVTVTLIENALQDLSKVLKDANEVELILMNLTSSKTKTELYDGRKINSDLIDKGLAIAKERANGAPLQYLLKEQNFFGLDFVVDSNVLIPRGDTEILVEKAIKIIQENGFSSVLDICTGSGAIGITIAKNTDAKVTLSDISSQALTVATANATKNEVDVKVINSDMFASIEEKYDVIVCNPPYIPTLDILKLDKDVKDYEPQISLDGGNDGLDFYRIIAKEYKNFLNTNGVLLLELGIGQIKDVADMFGGATIESIKDYNNPPIDRVLIIR